MTELQETLQELVDRHGIPGAVLMPVVMVFMFVYMLGDAFNVGIALVGYLWARSTFKKRA